MKCLNCQKDIQPKQSFWHIYCLFQEDHVTCQDCQRAFQRIENNHCPFCYKLGSSVPCKDCLAWQKIGYDVNHESLFTYNTAMKDYFSRFKFGGDFILAGLFASDIKSALKKYREYTIVPIPLSYHRQKVRQFNQVQALLDKAKVSYKPLLEKTEDGVQSSKTRTERLLRQQPFSFKKEQELPRKILIVDDIYTTGNTLYLATQLFEKEGVTDIKTFSLAR